MTSGKLETTVVQSQVSGESKRGSGLGEEEEEKVGVVSECNIMALKDQEDLQMCPLLTLSLFNLPMT
jgi:hypothetical protein